jgi:hypothetical protein
VAAVGTASYAFVWLTPEVHHARNQARILTGGPFEDLVEERNRLPATIEALKPPRPRHACS